MDTEQVRGGYMAGRNGTEESEEETRPWREQTPKGLQQANSPDLMMCCTGTLVESRTTEQGSLGNFAMFNAPHSKTNVN